ncbi:MAG: thiol-disulfide isomerase/thioredoxin [Flavobacteriaceae bacterium]|jgi:thiol-disulfide isomerase/thioredoxin|tara:strand:+ start:1328 stop:1891 length:564 start_codon:yes stop_codon:yes gene_type:complete
MKISTSLTFLFIIALSCISPTPKKAAQQPLEVASIIGEEGETVLLGHINRANLNIPEFKAWFKPEYENIKIPEGWAATSAPLAKNLEFKLFLGTWCGDTQRELGGMFKLLDLLGVTEDRIEMYCISEYKDSPLGYEKEYDILYIPTLIFIENGKELNRIVEFPVENLVEDFSKILKKQPYQDSYANF